MCLTKNWLQNREQTLVSYNTIIKKNSWTKVGKNMSKGSQYRYEDMFDIITLRHAN
jgi:hypothetical protein